MLSSIALPSSGFWDFLSPTPVAAILLCFGNPPFNEIERPTH
jgi:hypothetical protein